MKASSEPSLIPRLAVWQRLLANRWLRVFAGIFLSALSLYLALREISWVGITSALSGVHWEYLAAAAGCLVLHHWAKAVRWQSLLRLTHPVTLVDSSFPKVLMALLAGQMLNLVYPARVGDFSRAIMIGNGASGKVSAGGTIILEKALDTILFSALIIILACLVTLPGWLSGSLWGIAFLLFVLLTMITVLIFRSDWLEKGEKLLLTWISHRSFLQTLEPGKIEGLFESFHTGLGSLTGLSSWRTSILLAGWSLLIWGMSLFVNVFVILALDLPFLNPITILSASLLVLVGLQVGISLPAVPGRVGIFEYICVLAMSFYGISAGDAFPFGLLLHILVMVPLLFAGLVSMPFVGLSRAPISARQNTEQVETSTQDGETDLCKQ